MSVCVVVCLYRRISLTAEPIGPGKVYNYFGGGYHHPPKRNYKKLNFFTFRDSYATLVSIAERDSYATYLGIVET